STLGPGTKLEIK
nr:Ig kappa-1 chain J3 region - rabbit [Oryctolagus cuniculus]